MTDKLNDKQYKAIELIISGYTDQETALEIGVSRQTVNQWKNQNNDFIITLGQRRKSIRDAIQDRTERLTFKALDVLYNSLDAEDMNVSTALSILKLYKPQSTVLITNEDELRHQRKINDLMNF